MITGCLPQKRRDEPNPIVLITHAKSEEEFRRDIHMTDYIGL
jgi:hypothetical protein